MKTTCWFCGKKMNLNEYRYWGGRCYCRSCWETEEKASAEVYEVKSLEYPELDKLLGRRGDDK